MAGVKGHLFGFCKKVVGVAVEHHLADELYRHLGLGDQLGRVKNVETKLAFLPGVNNLHAQFPFREVAAVNGLPEVAPVEVGVLAGNLLGFIPGETVNAELGFPVELHEV